MCAKIERAKHFSSLKNKNSIVTMLINKTKKKKKEREKGSRLNTLMEGNK